jgi:GPH family glycoside/pentoside/hexuronide:cation symporter
VTNSRTTIAGEAPLASLRTDISYALITLGSATLWSILGGWLLYFYLPPQGETSARVPAALLGTAMLATRVLNGLVTPPIGYLSDRTRSRWGRRLPYMFVSALPMLALFVLLWRPPVSGESIWNLAYLVLILGLYNLAYVINQIPYTALLPELAVTDRQRVRLSAWTSGLMLVGTIAGGLAGPLIDRFGYMNMSLIYAATLLPLFYLPFLALRESQPARAVQRASFWQDLATLFQNRAFVLLTATGAFYWGITALVQATIPYIVTEVCLLGTADTMLFYIPALLASLLCYPLITWLATRVNKHAIFSISLLASAVVLPGLLLIGDWLPMTRKAQGITWITLQAIALSGVIMLQPTLGAEVIDHDEQLTGQRREGIYYAAWGVLDQIVNGITSGVLPLLLLLGRSHTDPHGPLGVRMVGVLGGIMMLAAFITFRKYPLRHRSAP